MIKGLLNSKKIVYFVVIIFSVYGILSFQSIAKREFPNTALPVISTTVVAPGYTASEIADEIVPIIEEDIKQLDGVNQVNSTSFDNGAMILTQFNMDITDITEYIDDLDKEIGQNEYPENVSVTSASDFNEAQVVYAITGANANDVAIDFKKQLEQVNNVSSVDIDNENIEQLVYTVNLQALEQSKISFSTFVEIVAGIGTEVPLGYIEQDDESYSFIATNNFTSKEELENFKLINNITLGELGEVKVEKISDTYYEYGDEEAVFINVYFENNIDYTNVGDDVLKTEAEFEYEGDYELNRLVFQPDSVNAQINSVVINLVEAVILVVIIVMIGLGFKNSILIGLSLPFTIFGTIGILSLLGQDLQQISIAGLIISIGIVVDNAIVINDAIVHKLDQKIEKRQAIIESVRENSIPVFTSTATTIAAFSPIIFLQGIAGIIAFSLPITVIIALILSYVFSVVITPLLAEGFLKDKIKTKETKKKREFKFLKYIIKRPYISILIIIVSLAVTSIVALSLQIVVFPAADKDIIYVQYSNTESTKFDDTVKMDKEIIEYINSLDYIKDNNEAYASVVGGRMPQFYSTLPTLPLLPNQGFIYLDMNNDADITDLKEQLNDELFSEFGARANIKAKEVELNTPTAPIVVTLSGENTEKINAYANDSLSDIESIDGVEQVDINVSNKVNSYTLKIKDNVFGNYGVTAAQIEQEIAQMLNDNNINVIDSEDYSSDLVIRSNVNSVDELLNTSFIFNDVMLQGEMLFEIETSENYDKFTNIDYENSATIDVYLEPGVGVLTVQDEIDNYLQDNKDDDVNYSFSGEVDLMGEVFSGVGVAAAFAIVIIFLILLLQFGSFRNTFIIILSVPLSFMGSIIALKLFNLPLSFTAGLGLTALMGIVVNNGILLLSYIKEFEKTHEHLSEVCYLAIERRFRPIVLSNTTTAIGLIPLIISGGDFFRPMAVALAGGIVVGTLLTIFVVPSIYYLINRKVFNNSRNNNK